MAGSYWCDGVMLSRSACADAARPTGISCSGPPSRRGLGRADGGWPIETSPRGRCRGRRPRARRGAPAACRRGGRSTTAPTGRRGCDSSPGAVSACAEPRHSTRRAGDRRHVHWRSHRQIRLVGCRHPGAVAMSGPRRIGEHRISSRPSADHGGGDPLALEWVDQSGGVTDEQCAAPAGMVPTMPIFSQPPSRRASTVAVRRPSVASAGGRRRGERRREMRRCVSGRGRARDRRWPDHPNRGTATRSRGSQPAVIVP